MEVSALAGFTGGGIGGGLGSSGGKIEINSYDDILHLSEGLSSSTHNQKVNQSFKAESGVVSQLDKTVLGSGRGKSEGVGEELVYVSGGDGAGPHKIIDSKSHSQNLRELFGGRRLSRSMGWFGPRVASRQTAEMYKEIDPKEKKNLGDLLRESGEYIDRQDLQGISEYWGRRSINLEEEILELYRPRSGGLKTMGEDKEKQRVALEIDLKGVKDILEKTEEELKRGKGTYGEGFNSSGLKMIRLAGSIEGTVFNYLKKMIGPEEAKQQRLKEKDIATVIKKLMNGEKVGFDCESGEEDLKSKFFGECTGHASEGVKVKAVLKSAGEEAGKYVPTQHMGAGGRTQTSANYSEGKKLNTMDDVGNTKVIEENCELGGGLGSFIDTSLKIRQKVCQLLVIPGFGDLVSDKRLCLMELENFKYYLRLQTYFKTFDFPTGHNKNTFGTKCSNYGI